MRQTYRVGATPRDEFKLDQVVELRHRLVALLPIAVQAHNFGRVLINHQNVRRNLFIRVLVLFALHVDVRMKHSTQSVDVFIEFLALDLVIRFFALSVLGLHHRANDIDVAIQPALDPAFKLLLSDVLHVRSPLSSVEIARCER